MTPFLQHIIDTSGAKASDNSSLYIFPNRRSGLHFKLLLAKQLDQPIWSPTVLSGADLIQDLYRPNAIADSLTLLFELYVVYQQVAQQKESFDKFFPWGTMMLKDFDEADRYLIDGDRLFHNVRDLREMEDRFRLDLKEEEAFVSFWQTFSHEPIDQWRHQFAAIWKELGRLYKAFRHHLLERNLAYEGMAYRSLAEDLSWVASLPYNQIFICGFNALSTSEKKIFQALRDQRGAQLLWDADTWYLDNPEHEAGHFLRENFQDGFERPSTVGSPLTTLPKTIDATGIPGGHGQIQVAVDQLRKWSKEKDFKPEETAIVLGDESLLFPLLYALPTEVKHFNITMGYPLLHAYTYSFIAQLLQLQVSLKGSTNQPAFSHRLVAQLLQHPFVQYIAGESAAHLHRQLIDQKQLFPTAEWLQTGGHSLLKTLFTPQQETTALLAYLKQTLLSVSEHLESHGSAALGYEPAFLLHYYKMLQRLEDLLETYNWELSKDLLEKLLRQMATAQTLPFSGEPVQGVQIMGLLETRLLDFKRVLVLSVNEGQLPSTNRHHSYIPYGIRKAFGMPTFEQQDGLSAYHFFRLLQRTQHASLLYNTIPGRMSEGEPSRFLKQLEFEWEITNPDLLSYHNRLATVPPKFTTPSSIQIEKDDRVMAQLIAYTAPEKNKHFSASSLNTYINCSLQYYFTYVAGLQEPDELEESIDAVTLGNIFHHAMEEIYSPSVNQEISSDQIKIWESNIEDALLQQYREHYEGSMDRPEGKNVLNFAFLKESAQTIFQYEGSQVPFTVAAVEQKHFGTMPFSAKGKTLSVTFKGLFDREDKKEGVHYILDYKTGSILDLKGDAINKPEVLRENPKKKAILQGLLYAWLYLANHPDEEVKVGFYHLQNLQQGPSWLSEQSFRLESLDPFIAFIQSLLAEIFDPATPFSQTDDHKRCEFCSFKTLCDR